MKTKIGAIITPYGPARGIMAATYSQACEELKKAGLAIELRIENMVGADQTAIDPVPDFMNWLEDEADIILVLIPAAYNLLFTDIKELAEKTGKPVVPLTADCAPVANKIHPDNFQALWSYQSNGGLENIKNLILFSLNITGFSEKSALPPLEMPFSGIYHPLSRKPFGTLEEYLAWRPFKPDSYTIGLFFPRSYWIDNSLEVFDALIRELEERGANVIAVFNDKFKSRGDDAAIEKYFMKDGSAVIDIALFQAYFFLKSRREKGDAGHRQEGTDILKRLNVPALLMINSLQSKKEYGQNPEGLTIPQYIIAIALPEFDGISQPVLLGVSDSKIDPATGAKIQHPIPLSRQVVYLADRIFKWCALRRKPNSDKKIAVILHNSPCKSGVEATVGAGFGLDTLESVALLLQRMKGEDYRIDWVPKNGKELIETILERKAISEFRWTPLSEIVKRGGAAGFVELDSYREWLEELPEISRSEIFKGWGDPFKTDPARMDDPERMGLALHQSKIVIPGLILGNVFIGLQPKRGCAGARCDGSVCKMLHDPQVPPPHQYLAFYKWVEKDFKADGMIHVGTHGNIELLPGKSVALSPSCFSHFAVGTLPHLYIYVVSNPMEGSIAKRRGLAVIIDHLHPIMTSTKLYGPLEELEDPLEEYSRARAVNDRGRIKELEKIITEKARQASIIRSAEDFPDFDAYVDYLHGQINMLSETMFRDGLHILGQPPRGEQLINILTSILRFDQGDVPSLRRWVIETIGLSYEEVLERPEALDIKFNLTHSKLLQIAHNTGKRIIERALENKDISDQDIFLIAQETIREEYGIDVSCLINERKKSLVWIIRYAQELTPSIEHTVDEIENVLRGFNGEFIEPGASGALARGKVETLPTGRNFYSIDPFKIPTPAAWNVGIKLADIFFHRYLHEQGEYPENIGFVFRFFDVFRADGEQLAQMLYTLGIKPVWDGSRITGLEAIPLTELKRPRVDITVQLSNMLRDGCPRAFELVDEAVQLAADLDEPLEQNYVRKHVVERLAQMQDEEDDKKKKRQATFRIFTAAPGVYDYGSNTALASSAWETDEDLAKIFINTCHYAYGKGAFGVPAREDFKANLKQVTVTYDKWDSDEYDILECCHIFGSHGGFTQAAKTVSGNEVKVYFGDTHDPDRPKIRDMKEELDRVARTRLLNPEWIEGKKRHGYKGASVISDRVFHIYGWQATTHLLGNWVFNEIAEKLVLDNEMREWFKKNNIYAMESITRRLIEAEKRQLWKADPDKLERLKEVFLDIEGCLEETMDDLEGDFQGSNIQIIKVSTSR